MEKPDGLAEEPLGRHHLVPLAEEGEEGSEGGGLPRGQGHGLEGPLQALSLSSKALPVGSFCRA